MSLQDKKNDITVTIIFCNFLTPMLIIRLPECSLKNGTEMGYLSIQIVV